VHFMKKALDFELNNHPFSRGFEAFLE